MVVIFMDYFGRIWLLVRDPWNWTAILFSRSSGSFGRYWKCYIIYIMQTSWCWKCYISIMVQHLDWILWVDAYIYMRHWMRCGAGSLVLKQGWVLLAGFVGCSWGIAFYWKYVGSSVGCWLFIYGSLLMRVLAPDRGCQACTMYAYLAWDRLPSVTVVISCRPYSMGRDASYLV